MPLISYKIWEISLNNQNISLVSPNSEDQNVLGASVRVETTESSFPAFISNIRRDTLAPYDEFKISVPSIKIEEARVIADTNDFEKNLAHLPGTALPGEKGNVFITGHSSLPQLYKKDNYKAIFAHLPEIKKGDEILVDTGGQRFTYRVQSLKVVDPKDTWVINPPDDEGRYLTLMTCVPPGLYLKRLVVLAKLQ